MKKIFVLLLLFYAVHNQAICAVKHDTAIADIMDQTWSEFRQIHPYSYQTIGIRHVDSTTCVLVISEPAPEVSESEISALFKRHNGQIEVKKHQLGHDGWTKDIVGYMKSGGILSHKYFSDTLFSLVYGTNYKPFYTDLDHPSEDVHFVPYEYRLNHSWSTMDLNLLLNYRVQFNTKAGLCNIKQLMKLYNSTIGDCIFESSDYGFIVWLIDPSIVKLEDPNSLTTSIIHNYFRASARRFALDTDMIIGAFGDTTGVLAIIGREREIPVSICPPLRAETILLMAQTNILDLGQAFDPNSGHAEDGRYVSSILMSDQIRDSEFGNLLIMTDQMLKSWIENNYNQDCHYNLPAPAFFPFSMGLKKELDCSTIECRWLADNLDSCIQKFDTTTIYSFKQTASLSVCLSTEEVPTKLVNDAETTASNYLSGLNQAELFRTTQYTTLCQLFNAHWWGIHVNDSIAEAEDDISGQDMTLFTQTSHNSWLKTPSITCSNEPWVFGGFGRTMRRGAKSVRDVRSWSSRDSRLRRARELNRITTDYSTYLSKQQKGNTLKTLKHINSGHLKLRNLDAKNPLAYNSVSEIVNQLYTFQDFIGTFRIPDPITNQIGTTIGEDISTMRHISSELSQYKTTLSMHELFTRMGGGQDLEKLPKDKFPNYINDYQFIFNCLTNKDIDLTTSRSTSDIPSDSYMRILNAIKDLQSEDKPLYNRFIQSLKALAFPQLSAGELSTSRPRLIYLSENELNFLSDFPNKYNSNLEKLGELVINELIRLPQKTRSTRMLPQWLEKPKVSTHKVHVEPQRTSYQIHHKKDKFINPGYDINLKSPQWNTWLDKHTVGQRTERGFTENLNKPYCPKRSIIWDEKEIDIQDEGQLNELLDHHEAETNVVFQEYSAAEDKVTINGQHGQQSFIVSRDNANWDMTNAEYEGFKDNNTDGTTSFIFHQNESDLGPSCKESKAIFTVPSHLKETVLNKVGKVSFFYKVITNPELFRNVLHELKNIHRDDFKLEINKLYGQTIFLKEYNYETEFLFQSAA